MVTAWSMLRRQVVQMEKPSLPSAVEQSLTLDVILKTQGLKQPWREKHHGEQHQYVDEGQVTGEQVWGFEPCDLERAWQSSLLSKITDYSFIKNDYHQRTHCGIDIDHQPLDTQHDGAVCQQHNRAEGDDQVHPVHDHKETDQEQDDLGGPFLRADARGEGHVVQVLGSPLMPEQESHHVHTREQHAAYEGHVSQLYQHEKQAPPEVPCRGK
nr:uncharacterized protein LOC109731351 [Microcebus murinus]